MSKFKTTNRYIAILLLVFSGSAFGDFKCIIKDAVHLEDDGTLNHQSDHVVWYVGKEITVDRPTGIITGAKLSNTMSGKMPTVLDKIPSKNSFRTITVYTHRVDYLQIDQFVEAKEKPFFYMGAWGTMVSGTCISY
jgi:hypothetical protein